MTLLPDEPIERLDPEAIVREFWRLMATNDFDAVRDMLADNFVMEWPQSRERVVGGARFVQMNADFPATGRWRFRIQRLVADGARVVTQVSVSDGRQSAEPISFFTVARGKIARLVEFWPDSFGSAEHRRPPIARRA